MNDQPGRSTAPYSEAGSAVPESPYGWPRMESPFSAPPGESAALTPLPPASSSASPPARFVMRPRLYTPPPPSEHSRSEEHTSELQSRPHLVCRLLLEKKK